MVDILLGAPLLIGLGEVGPLVTSLGALETVFGELTSGDPTTVLTELIDGPAYIANAFLNGVVPPGLDVLGQSLNLLDGVLVPDTNLNIPVDVDLQTFVSQYLPELAAILAAAGITLPNVDLATITVGPFGGLIDALVNYVPQQIADALLADPPGAGTGLTGLLDPSTLLSGLNLGDLGGLLDPSTLAGDLTTLARPSVRPAGWAGRPGDAHSVLISEIAVAAAGPSADGAGLGVVS